MSEPKEYPEAYGIISCGQWADELFIDREFAEDALCDYTGDDDDDEELESCQDSYEVVELIPRPTVERMIAEAVAEATKQLGFLMNEARMEERERCKMIAEHIKLAPLWDFGTAQAIWDQIESGEQPEATT